ncbi:MAG: hypothetical protein HKO65_07695 [Gemmatimonadetes bacterium]|nr:hypothetical protein [Gemmatimonadota bacterium]NNM04972.1 hypothetical protein [Gemmatimonadota bacterium]
MKTWKTPFAMIAVLAVAAAGCEDGTTDTNDFDNDGLIADAALVAADGMFQDLAHMQSPTSWAGSAAGPEAVPIEIQGSKTFSRTVTFFPGDSYDPLLTESMHIVSDLTRQVTHTFWNADIARHRDMTVTGLAGEETVRTWNGSGTGDVFKSRHPEGGAVRTYDMESTATITNVVRAVPRADNPWPLSGTITRVIHAVRTKEGEDPVEKNLTVTITFNGTQFVKMVVDDGTGPVEYDVDLAERNVNRRFQRKNG